jgi:hypothetical protein
LDFGLKLVQARKRLKFQRHFWIVCKGVKQSLTRMSALGVHLPREADHFRAGQAGSGWYQSDGDLRIRAPAGTEFVSTGPEARLGPARLLSLEKHE